MSPNSDKSRSDIFSIKDKTILVTGAAGLIGREISKSMLQFSSGAADGSEVGRHLIRQRVRRADVITGQRADAFVARLDVPCRDRFAVLPSVALAPERIAGEVMREVAHVRA